MNFVLIVLSILVLLFMMLFFNKNAKLKRIVNEILDERRIGFYNSSGLYLEKDPNDKFYCRIFVEEVENYTNDMSKIKLHKIEVHRCPKDGGGMINNVKSKITNEFSTLRKTDSIEWLETLENVKELRKAKLNAIMKNI